MANLSFNYPLWDFSYFPLRQLLLGSPITSVTNRIFLNKMAASRGRLFECQLGLLSLLSLVSGAWIIQTRLNSAIFIAAKSPSSSECFYQYKIVVVLKFPLIVLHVSIFFPPTFQNVSLSKKWLLSFSILVGQKDIKFTFLALHFLYMRIKSRCL